MFLHYLPYILESKYIYSDTPNIKSFLGKSKIWNNIIPFS